MNEFIIKTEKLSFSYTDEGAALPETPEIPALNNVNFSVRRGEYVAVLGHNGSGKSTLAKLINMILVASSGKIYIDGVEITKEDFGEDEVFEIRKKIGMVFQNPDNQLVATVVEEDVAFGPENLGLPREEIRERVDRALELVGMTEYKKHAPHKLSGGQKQRVAIAGIIAMKPEVIIFDESTAMLDPKGRQQVVEIMERLNRDEGITVINITHYMEEAARADRVVVINDGSLLYDATPTEVFSRVRELREIGLEVPQPRELLYSLKSAGLEIDADALFSDDCAEKIINFLKGNKLNENE
jgi:energy-coupling factor transport system ATP-binding protein